MYNFKTSDVPTDNDQKCSNKNTYVCGVWSRWSNNVIKNLKHRWRYCIVVAGVYGMRNVIVSFGLLSYVLWNVYSNWIFYFLLWRYDPTRVMTSSFLRFLGYTQKRTTVGRTPLDEWSARRRELYLSTHNNHNRQISMPPVGFEPRISAGKRQQTYALDRAATGTGIQTEYRY
jgi:hypothetical protein